MGNGKVHYARNKSQDEWKWVLPILDQLFYDSLLPEIINPRSVHNMDVSEPQYVLGRAYTPIRSRTKPTAPAQKSISIPAQRNCAVPAKQSTALPARQRLLLQIQVLLQPVQRQRQQLRQMSVLFCVGLSLSLRRLQ